MPIVLTHHARERMVQRGITFEMVEETVFVPDSTGQSYGDTKLAFRRFGTGLLKVVYSTETGEHLIISAIWEEAPCG